ncbi:MAG: hypothetical protein H0T46_36190 [Deltaproteobacteria bacterium]|nr:hypothetical protein [Deltaproteobacteria bacterium]
MKAVVGTILVLGLAPAQADTPREAPAAIEVDREVAPPGRGELGFDTGAPVPGWAAAVSFGYLSRPITLRSAGGEAHPVDRRETLALGAALGLGDVAVLDARMPFARQTGDRLAALGDLRALDRWVPGDLRIGGRLRVVTTPRVDALLRAELTLPTGDEHDFAGEASWSVAWNLIGRFKLPAGIVVAASGGIRLRGVEVMLADRVVGDELHGGVGIVVPIPAIRPLWCVAEQVKLTGELVGILGDEVGGSTGPSPAEVRLGIVTRPRQAFTIGVRIGAGIGDQIGAPQYRATLELTYHGSQRLIPASASVEAEADESLEP